MTLPPSITVTTRRQHVEADAAVDDERDEAEVGARTAAAAGPNPQSPGLRRPHE